MKYYFELIRWKHLFVFAIAIYAVKYALLLPAEAAHNVKTSLGHVQFLLLVIAILAIMAAGFTITAIYSAACDRINNPKHHIINKYVGENDGYSLFIGLTIVGMGLGFYVSNAIDQHKLFSYFFVFSALWYVYGTALQQIAFISHLVKASLFGIVFLGIGIFELYPSMSPQNKATQIFFLDIIKDYTIFVGLITVVQHLVKNLRDIDGHHNTGWQTTAVLLGRQRTGKIAFVLSLLPIFAMVFYISTYMASQLLVAGILIAVVIAPLLYASTKLFTAKQKAEFNHIYHVYNLVFVAVALLFLLFKFFILK